MVRFYSNVIPALLFLQEEFKRSENKKAFIVIAQTTC